MKEKKSTRDKLLEAALALFSEKGYDAASVDQIAESIGITGPSIYRYFKGKDELLGALVEMGERHYSEKIGMAKDAACIPGTMNELIQMSLGQIAFTMHDEMVIKFRKLFIIEQFRNERIAELTTKHHITGLEDRYENIFREMMRAGSMKKDDPQILAMEYVAPISMMIHMVDRQPEREEEAMNRIRKHFEHFASVYGTE